MSDAVNKAVNKAVDEAVRGAGPGAVEAAEAAAEVGIEVLLRCWVREVGPAPLPGQRDLRIPLAASGLVLDVPVEYWSPTGWHRFGPPRMRALPPRDAHPPAGADRLTCADGAPVDAALLATLLVRELTAGAGLPAPAGLDALTRLLDSIRRIALYIEANRRAPAAARAAGAVPPFLAAERALVTGHPFHPAAKSRQGASDAELARYSPELAGSFPLHWFAGHPSVLLAGGRTAKRTRLTALLASLCEGAAIPPGYVPLPAHPWEARETVRQPEVARLLADGLLVDLGPAGPDWYPTASLRTVWHPDAPVMLKLSLGMRITNSRRRLHRSELELGAEMSRYVDLALADWLRARHPAFRLLPEPAWIALAHPAADEPDGTAGAAGVARPEGPGAPEVPALAAAIRPNPFGRRDRVACVAGLVADRPDLAARAPERSRRSMLATAITRLAARTSRTPGEVAAAWFARYLEVLAAPVLELYLHHGVGLEAHLQNTLVTLDDQGWPTAGWYRDSQGYYLAASHAAEARRRVPGFGDGVPAVFDDALVTERVIYYAVVNNLLAVVGALGAAGIADEARLLAVLRRLLCRLDRESRTGDAAAAAGGRGGRPGRGAGADLLGILLESSALPCKANLRTCVDGRDELVGPVATQSVYVQIPNPLVEVRP